MRRLIAIFSIVMVMMVVSNAAYAKPAHAAAPWDYAGYAACYWGGWAGSGFEYSSAIGVEQHCMQTWDI
jgi:hypothetical protein